MWITQRAVHLGLREENKQNLESVLGAVRSTAQEQVPYNISGVCVLPSIQRTRLTFGP